MKPKLFYNSINPRERMVAKLVEAHLPEAALVDVSSDPRFRESVSATGEPDRFLRCVPCLALDSDDGTVELERAEEVITAEVIRELVSRAEGHEKRLKTALKEAKKRHDVPGGARPILLEALRAGPGAEFRSE